MDDFTAKHLVDWVDRQFGPDQDELLIAMGDQYATDPEIYDRTGWWRCYDDMVREGRTTL